MEPLWRHTLRCVLAIALGGALLSPPRQAEASGPWSTVLFGGRATDGGIEEVPPNGSHFTGAYMAGIGLNRRLSAPGPPWAWEVEGQALKHVRLQHHAEANLALVLRWLTFPWDRKLDTSFAAGEGLSLASSVPEIEKQRSPDATSRMLNFLMFEVDLRPPARRWSVVLRLHHRSGVVGLYNGVHKGSNVYVVGVKWRNKPRARSVEDTRRPAPPNPPGK